ncbi:MAG: GNAT family N-acetyltransferase [Acidimicrobiales bacterium]
MSELELRLRYQITGSGSTCRHILDSLPHWFGIEESVENYVATADRSPTVVAAIDSADIGILTIVPHSPYAVEIYVMGILPEFHRHGVGGKMLAYAEQLLLLDGVEYLQVKTLSSQKEDTGYEKTRAFYQTMGFRVLEEFPNLWGPDNPALQMIKALKR